MLPTPAIREASLAIRPLPIVAKRVLETVRDPGFRIDELIALVRSDPALVVRILSLSNSTRRGLHAELTCISAAVAELGTRALVQIARATCSQADANGVEHDLAAARTEWRRRFARATICELLAARTSAADPATAFTVGMLHSLGDVSLPTDGDDADHATVAAMVANCWHLPLSIISALQHHHVTAELDGKDALPSLLLAAECISEASDDDRRPGDTGPLAPLTDRLRLDEDELRTVKIDAIDRAANAAVRLNLDPPPGR